MSLRNFPCELDGPTVARFDGHDYVAERDDIRLRGQLLRVYECMKDGRWRTLDEIHAITGDPPASILAQLGHLRKQRFGQYPVDKRHRGLPEHGLYEYHLGARGQGVLRPNYWRVRAEELAEALRAIDPDNPALEGL